MALDRGRPPANLGADLPRGECSECQQIYLYPGDYPPGVCPDCAERIARQAQIDRLLAELPKLVSGFLTEAGLSPRELRATLDLVPPTIQPALRMTSTEALLRGEIPRFGLGLSAPAGQGKTCALAAVVRQMAEQRLCRELPEHGLGALRQWLLWLSWPEAVNRMRIMSTREGGIIEVDALVQLAGNVELLVLDDLGSERRRDGYTEDWALSQFDLIVDTRYRAERPTLYTSSLTKAKLLDVYGERMFSRLVGENPLVEIAPGKDLRMGG